MDGGDTDDTLLDRRGPMRGVRGAVDHLKKEMESKSNELRESLRRFRGKVFHAVTSNNRVLQYRIGGDGRITLERTIQSLNLQSQKLHEAREKLLEAGRAVPRKAQAEWRKAVTGDPNKRIRDHMKEVPQVKMLDKISFTMGVLIICLSEYIVLRLPALFPLYYYFIIMTLFILRFYFYYQEKAHFFMLDFCYFVNVSCIIQSVFYPNNMPWFKTNFVLSMGPLCIAIIVWQNSLVFHSLDKLTSFFLHAYPPMLTHLYRWRLLSNEKVSDSLGFQENFLLPFGMYIAWQIGYLFVTELLLRNHLDSDPELVTSLRYLAKDKKNSTTMMVLKLSRKWGILGKDEDFDPESFKSKMIFVVTQMAYTMMTIFHVGLLYRSYYISCCYIITIFMWGTWNGASYYIEIFSKRYNMKFEKPSDTTKETQSESSTADHDNDDEEFVEALEHMDLNEPLTLELYNELLEKLVAKDTSSDDDTNSVVSDNSVNEFPSEQGDGQQSASENKYTDIVERVPKNDKYIYQVRRQDNSVDTLSSDEIKENCAELLIDFLEKELARRDLEEVPIQKEAAPEREKSEEVKDLIAEATGEDEKAPSSSSSTSADNEVSWEVVKN